MKQTNKVSAIAALTISMMGLAIAQDNNASAGLEVLEPFEVIGSKQNLQSMEGAGAYLETGDLTPFLHTDVNDILSQVPGVYLRGEEGYGLFPNISLRCWHIPILHGKKTQLSLFSQLPF